MLQITVKNIYNDDWVKQFLKQLDYNTKGKI